MTSCRICLSLSDLRHLAWCPPVRPCCCKWQNFILFYDWVIVQYFMADTQHIFFIPSSIDEVLVCFHTVEIVKNVAMNTEVHVSFWIGVFFFFCFLWVYTEEWHCWIISSFYFWFFWGLCLLFYTVASPIYILTNSVCGLHIILKSLSTNCQSAF